MVIHSFGGLGVCLLFAVSTLAGGAVQRTFVASNGVDTDPCSISQPCRSFGAAIGKTLAGGEVIVQDSAGYGIVTIAKSVSIIAPTGVYAGISVFAGQTGVTVNGAGIIVVLRGLSINGVGAGSLGVQFTQGARLRVESCVIANLASTGIAHSAAGAEMIVLDTVVRDNGGAGISVNGNTNVVLDHVRIEHNGGDGFNVSATSGFAQTDIRNSVFSHNGSSGVAAFLPGAPAETLVVIEDSVVSQNGVDGIFAGGISDGSLVIALRRNSISDNGASGISVFSGGGGFSEAHLADNTFLMNSLSATKADGAGARVFSSGSAFARGVSVGGYSFYTVNGGETFSWSNNTGYGVNFGSSPSSYPPF
jgi:Right handed beta helix region